MQPMFVIMVEVLTILFDMQVTIDCGVSKLIIELDCQSLIHQFQDPSFDISPFSLLVEDNLSFAHNFK